AVRAHSTDGAAPRRFIMRVFVTGASGWIGSAVIPELLAQGHEVLGLARSDAAADKVTASGAAVLRGDVQDIDVLREGAEQAARALAERGVRSMSVRFAPTVHGAGDHGFIARIIDADRSHGAAGYVSNGENRWPAVHRGDAARLVRLGIERAPGGSVLHAVAEEGVAMRDVAEALG